MKNRIVAILAAFAIMSGVGISTASSASAAPPRGACKYYTYYEYNWTGWYRYKLVNDAKTYCTYQRQTETWPGHWVNVGRVSVPK